MLSPEIFFKQLQKYGIDFFTGIPDSLLKSFCGYVTDHVRPRNHIIAANEGAAVGLSVGYHLATGKIPLVYMQNSGLGNSINPLMSIADQEVFSIPLMLIIGWRGEPGHKDEPQHVKQGRVMLSKLAAMEIPYEILGDSSQKSVQNIERAVKCLHKNSAPFALIVRKGVFSPYQPKHPKHLKFQLKREDAIKLVIDSLDKADVVVSTTGMASREVFEYREAKGDGHMRDFLTVGGMGHASQIALGISLQQPDRNIYCIDGDGAALMHLGSMAVNGQQKCKNFKHVLINNGAHDSVGGQPTICFDIDFTKIARAVGYKTVMSANTNKNVCQSLGELKNTQGPAFLEIQVMKGNRKDLGRPTICPRENKENFMGFLKKRS
jgi:phosphonopyruvate decarboxylase